MGYFTDTGIIEDRSHVLPPVTRERVTGILDDLSVQYRIDDDSGRVVIHFDTCVIFFHQFGKNDEVTEVRGLWRPDLTQSDFPRALDLINSHNNEKLWPRMSLSHRKDGAVVVYADRSVDFEHGVTHDQLHYFIKTSIFRILECFDEWGEHYPHLVREIDHG